MRTQRQIEGVVGERQIRQRAREVAPGPPAVGVVREEALHGRPTPVGQGVDRLTVGEREAFRFGVHPAHDVGEGCLDTPAHRLDRPGVKRIERDHAAALARPSGVERRRAVAAAEQPPRAVVRLEREHRPVVCGTAPERYDLVEVHDAGSNPLPGLPGRCRQNQGQHTGLPARPRCASRVPALRALQRGVPGRHGSLHLPRLIAHGSQAVVHRHSG